MLCPLGNSFLTVISNYPNYLYLKTGKGGMP
jgi:hypothetical protein